MGDEKSVKDATVWSGHRDMTLEDVAVIQPGLGRIMPEIGARTWKAYYAAKAGHPPPVSQSFGMVKCGDLKPAGLVSMTPEKPSSSPTMTAIGRQRGYSVLSSARLRSRSVKRIPYAPLEAPAAPAPTICQIRKERMPVGLPVRGAR